MKKIFIFIELFHRYFKYSKKRRILEEDKNENEPETTPLTNISNRVLRSQAKKTKF